MLAARPFQAAAAARPARRPWGKLQVEHVEDKLGDLYERHARRWLKRFKTRVRRKYEVKAANDFYDDEFGGDLETEDEYAELEEQIRQALQISLRLAENRGKAEGHYKTTAVQNRLDTGVEAQLAYLKGAKDDMRRGFATTVNDIIDEEGPNLNRMMVELEQDYPITVARARTIAVTETEKVYGWAYADILEENGWNFCTWRASPDEKVCIRPVAPWGLSCSDLDGEVMTLARWRELFPLHPNCQCWNEGYKGDWTGY